MSRCLLHVGKLQAFKDWLTINGIEYRSSRGPYEVIQVLVTPPYWYCVYGRINMPEHYTVDRRLEPTVRRFINETEEPTPCPNTAPALPQPLSSLPPWEA
jgi:hypothetical protein